jgi:hypothetical protein
VEGPQQPPTDITLPGIPLLMEAIRMSDELPLLRARLPDRKKVYQPNIKDLAWTDPESLRAAQDVFARLKRGASIEQLEKESGRCSFWVYKVLLTFQDAGQLA